MNAAVLANVVLFAVVAAAPGDRRYETEASATGLLHGNRRCPRAADTSDRQRGPAREDRFALGAE